jgi:hypothetical protein
MTDTDTLAAERRAIWDAVDKEWRAKPSVDRVAAAVKLLRDRAAKAQEGPLAGEWEPAWDSCDCGGGYPCGHGDYTVGVRYEQPINEPVGREPSEFDYQADTEIPTEGLIWMLTVQPVAGQLLADVLEQGADRPEVVALADAILAQPAMDRWSGVNAVEAGLAEHPMERAARNGDYG